MDSPTVGRVLSETRRVLAPSGRLIIKIPDFDRAIEAWRKGEEEFFQQEEWNYPAFVRTWGNRGMSPSLDYRAAAIFCAFWTAAHGNPFAGESHEHPDAFFGPPHVALEILHRLRDECTPSQISARLREIVLAQEHSITFNHQNAWSRSELAELLGASGFRVKTFDSDQIIAGCADIPEISSVRRISTFCWAQRTEDGMLP